MTLPQHLSKYFDIPLIETDLLFRMLKNEIYPQLNSSTKFEMIPQDRIEIIEQEESYFTLPNETNSKLEKRKGFIPKLYRIYGEIVNQDMSENKGYDLIFLPLKNKSTLYHCRTHIFDMDNFRIGITCVYIPKNDTLYIHKVYPSEPLFANITTRNIRK
jgi:hypothetical protein